MANSVQIQIGGDQKGTLVIGDHNVVVEKNYGVIVNRIEPSAPMRPKPRPAPVTLLPRKFEALLDRSAESQAVAPGRATEFWGEPGMGKSSLLRSLAHAVEPLPDGNVFLSARTLDSEDLRQSVFEAFYETDGPYKATQAEIALAFQSKRFWLILDDVGLDRETFDSLRSALPECSLITASGERLVWDGGNSVELPGLPADDALALYAREYGSELSPDARAAARQLCASLGGEPLAILQAAARARTGDTRDRRALGVLGFYSGAPVAKEHAVAISGSETAGRELDELVALKQVSQEDGLLHYEGARSESDAAAASAYFALWAEANQHDRPALASAAPALERTVQAASAGGRWQDVLRIVRASEWVPALGARWGAWRRMLDAGLAAARASGDDASEAYCLHQLGSRALCLGELALAQSLLEQSLAIRERLGDPGANVTRHNLHLIAPPAPVPKPPKPTSLAPYLVVGAIVVGLLGFVLGGGLGTNRNGNPVEPVPPIVSPSWFLSDIEPSIRGLRVSWTGGSGSAELERALVPLSGTPTAFETVTTIEASTRTFDDVDVLPNRRYAYRIAAGQSSSEQVTGLTLPAAPQDVSAVEDGGAIVRWSDPDQADLRHTVYVAAQGGEPSSSGTADPGESQLVVNGLSPGSTYVFTVTALNDSGESPQSDPVRLSLDALAPILRAVRCPASLESGQGGVGTIVLSREAPPGGTKVLLATDSPSALKLPDSVRVPEGERSASFDLAALDVEGRVVARIDATVDEEPSKTAQVTVVPKPRGRFDLEAQEIDLAVEPVLTRSGGSTVKITGTCANVGRSPFTGVAEITLSIGGRTVQTKAVRRWEPGAPETIEFSMPLNARVDPRRFAITLEVRILEGDPDPAPENNKRTIGGGEGEERNER